MKNISRIIILTLFLLFRLAGAHGQEYSKSSLTYHIGIGASNTGEPVGEGLVAGAGYQLNVWKDRLHFNPRLTLGYFDAANYLDLPDGMFTSLNLETIFFFDLIRFKTLSLLVGAGGVVQKINGLVGTGGYADPVTNSYYVHQWHYGVYVGCGISYYPKKSRFFFQIMPFNYRFLSNNRLDQYSNVGFGIKI